MDGKYIGEQLRGPPSWPASPWSDPCTPCATATPRALRRIEAPLEAVQAGLDHSNVATTSIYLRQLEGHEDPWWPKLAVELGLHAGGEAAPPAEERR